MSLHHRSPFLGSICIVASFPQNSCAHEVYQQLPILNAPYSLHADNGMHTKQRLTHPDFPQENLSQFTRPNRKRPFQVQKQAL